jgi:hypothetical protein
VVFERKFSAAMMQVVWPKSYLSAKETIIAHIAKLKDITYFNVAK